MSTEERNDNNYRRGGPTHGLRVNIAVAAMKSLLGNPEVMRGSNGPSDQKTIHDVVKDSFAYADEMLRRHFATRPERGKVFTGDNGGNKEEEASAGPTVAQNGEVFDGTLGRTVGQEI